jgi:uncharacterized protein (DUF2147 family)
MRKSLAIAALAFCSATATLAQMTPVGTWHTLDEKTKELKSEVQITEAGGVLTGKVTKLLRKEARQDAVCDECTDDRKGKPMLGLEIIRGAKKADGKDVWEGGKIMDPENGKSYTLKMTPIEGGRKLEVRGTIGPFGTTRTWVRTP